MQIIRSIILALGFIVAGGVAVVGQDWIKGWDAYDKGDYQAALKEWLQLAEQGYAGAQYNLGQMYRNGKGVIQDYAEALKWYRLAAEQGDADAQNNLGAIYEYGLGVLQNNILSHMLYNIASANVSKKPSEWRDKLAAKITPEDISKAQTMARECMSSNYQNCGWWGAEAEPNASLKVVHSLFNLKLG